jgi:hypothetical protein
VVLEALHRRRHGADLFADLFLQEVIFLDVSGLADKTDCVSVRCYTLNNGRTTYELVVAPEHPDEVAPEVLFAAATWRAEDRHPLLERLVEPAGALAVLSRQILDRRI